MPDCGGGSLNVFNVPVEGRKPLAGRSAYNRHSNAWPLDRMSCWAIGTGLPAARSICMATRRSEEHTSELQSLMRTSYAVFCLKKKKKHSNNNEKENEHTKHQ